MKIFLLIAALIASGALLGQQSPSSIAATRSTTRPATPPATPEPCPDSDLWNATLAGSQGYGAASLRHAFLGLEWINRTQSPVRYISVARNYVGSVLEGPVNVSSVISQTPPYTFTFELSDLDTTDAGTARLGCYTEVPNETAVDIHGVITSVVCDAGDCRLSVDIDRVDNFVCPTPTPGR